jgi:hypothetical protein
MWQNGLAAAIAFIVDSPGDRYAAAWPRREASAIGTPNRNM